MNTQKRFIVFLLVCAYTLPFVNAQLSIKTALLNTRGEIFNPDSFNYNVVNFNSNVIINYNAGDNLVFYIISAILALILCL